MEYYRQYEKTCRFEDPSQPFRFERQSLSFEPVDGKITLEEFEAWLRQS